MSKFLVSIATITYNHEKYISKCIESVVNQETTFNFEMIIGEDFSSDNTKKIIQEYRVKYPDIIFPIYNRENLGNKFGSNGGRENFLNVLKQCSGKYIAILDGDDVMSEGKLQMQANILEENLKISGVCHKMKLINEYDETIGSYGLNKNILFDINYLTKNGMFFVNSSGFFRRKCLDIEKFEKLHKYTHGDWFMYSMILSHNNMMYINNELGKYRKHINGITNKEKDIQNVMNIINIKLDIIDKSSKFGANDSAIFFGKARLYFMFAKRMLLIRKYSIFKDLIEKSYLNQNISYSQKILYLIRNNIHMLKIFLIIRYHLSKIRKIIVKEANVLHKR